MGEKNEEGVVGGEEETKDKATGRGRSQFVILLMEELGEILCNS